MNQYHKTTRQPALMKLYICLAFSILAGISQSQAADLSVSSMPNGADVYLDGQLCGQTPIIIVDLEPGNYKLKIKRDNLEGIIDEIEIKPGESQVIDVRLERLTGNGSIEDEAKGLWNWSKRVSLFLALIGFYFIINLRTGFSSFFGFVFIVAIFGLFVAEVACAVLYSGGVDQFKYLDNLGSYYLPYRHYIIPGIMGVSALIFVATRPNSVGPEENGEKTKRTWANKTGIIITLSLAITCSLMLWDIV